MINDEPSIFEESEDEEEEQKKNPEDRKRLFRRELAAMLYGFGDKKEPSEDTLETLEKIILYYIEQLCTKALNVGKPNRIGLDDIYYLIRRDQKKYARVKELLSMSEELKKARKAFDDAKDLV